MYAENENRFPRSGGREEPWRSSRASGAISRASRSEQGYLDAGGVRTRYLRAGDPGKPVLVLLHGSGGHAEAYVRNLARARRAFLDLVDRHARATATPTSRATRWKSATTSSI